MILPEGWHHYSVDDLADVLTGFAFESDNYVEQSACSVRLLRGDNITPSAVRWASAKYWPAPYDKNLVRYELEAGDIAIALDRPIIGAGLKLSVLGENDLPCLLVQRVARVRAKEGVSQNFLAHALRSQRFVDHLKGKKTETAVPHVSPSDVRTYLILTPSLPEQAYIARVLGAWDQAIATNEHLLANTRLQKQSLIQSLYPQARARHARWSFVDFDAVFERVTRKNTSNNVNVLTISGEQGLVSQRDYFSKSVSSNNLSGYTLLHYGEFAYNKSYSSGYPMGAIKPLTRYESGVVSSLYICFRFRDGIEADPDFFRHYFEAGMLNEGVSGIAQEGARNHGLLNVGIGDFFKLRLHIPDVEEQRRIAAVINMAEQKELLIGTQIAKLREEKRALMQQLLTAKRRVHLPQSEEAQLA